MCNVVVLCVVSSPTHRRPLRSAQGSLAVSICHNCIHSLSTHCTPHTGHTSCWLLLGGNCFDGIVMCDDRGSWLFVLSFASPQTRSRRDAHWGERVEHDPRDLLKQPNHLACIPELVVVPHVQVAALAFADCGGCIDDARASRADEVGGDSILHMRHVGERHPSIAQTRPH